MNFVLDNINGLYSRALAFVLDGREVRPRGMATREQVGVSMILLDPYLNMITKRPLNYRFMVAEFVWMITGQTRTELLVPFNSQMERFSDDGHHLLGSYGPPLVDQLPWVIQTLQHDPDSRQGVLTIWRPRPMGSKDIPCTISMQFLLREDKLEMVTSMRSQDAWLGFPYDLFNFTMIQRYVAAALSVKAGPYHHHVGSLHLYEEHWDPAREIILHHCEPFSSEDLGPSYPWPIEILDALSRRAWAKHDPHTWSEIHSILTGCEGGHWVKLLRENGVQPKGWPS